MFLILHIGFMSAAFLSVSAGVTAAFRRKAPSWFRVHQTFGVMGLIAALLGFFSILTAISLIEGEHFGNLHTWAGMGAIVFVTLTPLLGRLLITLGSQGLQFRPWHIWSGRTALALMAVNIALGISMILS